MMQKITKSALMSVRFPLPSKNEQNLMMAQTTEARLKATDLRERTRETRSSVVGIQNRHLRTAGERQGRHATRERRPGRTRGTKSE